MGRAAESQRLTVPVEARVAGMPAAVPGLIQGAVAVGAGRDGLRDLRIKDLRGIVLESPAAAQE